MLPRFQIQTFVWHPVEVIIEPDTRPILLGKLLVGLVIVAHEDRLELSRQIGMDIYIYRVDASDVFNAFISTSFKG